MVVLMLASLALGAEIPQCEDLTKNVCRLQFAQRNLPKLVKPDVNSPAGGKEFADIKKALDAGNQAAGTARALTKAIEKQQLELGDFEASFSRKLGLLTPLERAKKEAVQERIALLEKEKQVAEREKYAQRQIAIALTIQAWHLTPGVTVAPDRSDVVINPIKVQPWAPKYSENVREDGGHGRLSEEWEKTDLARRLGLPPGDKADYEGGTARDSGRVAAFPEAFNSPAALAALIYHETTHWLDAAARGRPGFPAESYRSEERAYNRVADQATIFGLDADKTQFYRGLAKRYASQAEQAKGLSAGQIRQMHPDWLPAIGYRGDPEPVKEAGGYEFLKAWSEQTTPLLEEAKRQREEQARRQAENADPYKQERDELRRQRRELDARVEAWLADSDNRFKAWDYLSGAAAFACSDPDALQAQAQEGRLVPVRLSSGQLRAYLDSPTWKTGDLALSPCQRDLLQRIAGASEAIAAAQLIGWSKTYWQAHPVRKSPTERLREFSETGDRYEKARPPREPRERFVPRGGNVPKDLNGPAFNDLKGLAG